MWEILTRRLSNALNAAILLLLGIYGLSAGAAELLAWALALVGGLVLLYNLNAILLRFQLWANRRLRRQCVRWRRRWRWVKGKLPRGSRKQKAAA